MGRIRRPLLIRIDGHEFRQVFPIDGNLFVEDTRAGDEGFLPLLKDRRGEGINVVRVELDRHFKSEIYEIDFARKSFSKKIRAIPTLGSLLKNYIEGLLNDNENISKYNGIKICRATDYIIRESDHDFGDFTLNRANPSFYFVRYYTLPISPVTERDAYGPLFNFPQGFENRAFEFSPLWGP